MIVNIKTINQNHNNKIVKNQKLEGIKLLFNHNQKNTDTNIINEGIKNININTITDKSITIFDIVKCKIFLYKIKISENIFLSNFNIKIRFN